MELPFTPYYADSQEADQGAGLAGGGRELERLARDQNCSDKDAERFYCAGMDRDVTDSLEAIANLIYLIRHSLHDPAAAVGYVDLAEENLKAMTLRFGLCPCASLPRAQ